MVVILYHEQMIYAICSENGFWGFIITLDSQTQPIYNMVSRGSSYRVLFPNQMYVIVGTAVRAHHIKW